MFIKSSTVGKSDLFTTLLLVVPLMNHLYRIWSRNACKSSIFCIWFKGPRVWYNTSLFPDCFLACRCYWYCKVSVLFVLNQHFFYKIKTFHFTLIVKFWSRIAACESMRISFQIFIVPKHKKMNSWAVGVCFVFTIPIYQVIHVQGT